MINLFIKQKAISVGDKYNVYDANNNLIFKANSKLLSPFYHKKVVYDRNGKVVMSIRRKVLDILPNYFVLDASGNKICRFKRKFSFFHKFKCYGQKEKIEFKGDLFSWNYSIYRNDNLVGTVSKKIIHIRDSYTLSIEDPKDAAFFVACVIAIDNLCHNDS